MCARQAVVVHRAVSVMLRTPLLHSLNCSACDVGYSLHGRLSLSVLSSVHFARIVAARRIRAVHSAGILAARSIRVVHFPPFPAGRRALPPIPCKGLFSCKKRGEVHAKPPVKCALRRALPPFSCIGTCTSLNSLHEFTMVQGIGGSARHHARIMAKCTPSLTYTILRLRGSVGLTAAGTADAAAACGAPSSRELTASRTQGTLRRRVRANMVHHRRPR